MTLRQLVGDCRVQLATLEAGSVQACVTSPPYYGLRSYQTPDLVWGGDAGHEHKWGIPGHSTQRLRNGLNGTLEGGKPAESMGQVIHPATGAFCPCGAWLGSLGLEPTPELYVEHIVECFRHVRRVLRDDGCMFVNLGDSYAGSGKGPSGQNGIGDQSERQGWEGSRRIGTRFKPKDLLMIPFRVAMALQADGWYLRSVIPWLKRNSMPESVTDRPSTAVEYVFLLSKSSRYYFDADAVRVQSGSEMSWEDYNAKRAAGTWPSGGIANYAGAHKHDGGQSHPNGRNRRNSDWFFESWQGLMLDEQDEPLALVVNPQPFKQSHFATFAPKLVEPMVKASTSERGQCPECGAPWARESTTEYLPTDRKSPPNKGQIGAFGERAANLTRDGWIPNRDPVRTTTGWRPSCSHTAEPIPQTVLDPFGGSGTVALVADRLGRNAVLVDLKPEYSVMAVDRLTGDAPMFVEVTETPA